MYIVHGNIHGSTNGYHTYIHNMLSEMHTEHVYIEHIHCINIVDYFNGASPIARSPEMKDKILCERKKRKTLPVRTDRIGGGNGKAIPQRGINKSMLMQVWRLRPGHILRCNNTAHFNCKCRFYNCTNCDQPYIKVCPAWLRLSLCHCCASAPHPNATVPSSLHLPLS